MLHEVYLNKLCKFTYITNMRCKLLTDLIYIYINISRSKCKRITFKAKLEVISNISVKPIDLRDVLYPVQYKKRKALHVRYQTLEAFCSKLKFTPSHSIFLSALCFSVCFFLPALRCRRVPSASCQQYWMVSTQKLYTLRASVLHLSTLSSPV